ncbi:hypothetical protein ABT301_29245 [Streptomyces sp. NPDC000987]|uniref:hypothetical protein n=1 Tax=Streptomyces sp. NPDC000987 TaxID=3154374 RepID=UPI00331C1743
MTSTGLPMVYEVDLTVGVEDALDGLPEDGRREVLEVIAGVLVRPGGWPPAGGWDGAVWFGPRSWVAFTAFTGGIAVHDFGWMG